MNRTSRTFRLATAAASVLLTLTLLQSVAMLAADGPSMPASASSPTSLALAASKTPTHSAGVR